MPGVFAIFTLKLLMTLVKRENYNTTAEKFITLTHAVPDVKTFPNMSKRKKRIVPRLEGVKEPMT